MLAVNRHLIFWQDFSGDCIYIYKAINLLIQSPCRRNHYKWPHVAQEPQDRPDQDEAKKSPDCFSSTAQPFVKDSGELLGMVGMRS